jgi:hypothetical protein
LISLRQLTQYIFLIGSRTKGPVFTAKDAFTPTPFFDCTEGFIIYSPFLKITEVNWRYILEQVGLELPGLISTGIVQVLFTNSSLNVAVATID